MRFSSRIVGLLLALWSLRQRTGIGFERSLFALLNWLSLSWTVIPTTTGPGTLPESTTPAPATSAP